MSSDFNHRYSNDDNSKSFEYENQNQNVDENENYFEDFELDVGSDNEESQIPPPSPSEQVVKKKEPKTISDTIAEIFPKISYTKENEDEGSLGESDIASIVGGKSRLVKSESSPFEFFNKPPIFESHPKKPKEPKPRSKSPTKTAIERMKAIYLEPQPKPKLNAQPKIFKEPELLTQELEAAKKLIKNLQTDRIQLNTKLMRTENEVKKKEKQLEEVISNKIKSSSLGGKNNPLSHFISENTIIQSLKSRIKTLEADLEKIQQEKLKLKERVRKVRVDALESKLEELYEEKIKLEEQLKHLLSPEFQQRIVELENQNQLLLEKLRKYKRELKKRLHIKKELETLKTQKKTDIESLSQHLGDTQKETELLKKTLKELKVKNKNLLQENELLQKEKEALTETMNANVPQSASEMEAEAQSADSFNEMEAFGEADDDFKENPQSVPNVIPILSKTEEKAAIKIQSTWRQHQAKKEYHELKKQKRMSNFREEKSKTLNKLKMISSAKKIQAIWRGYHSRNLFKLMKETYVQQSKPLETETELTKSESEKYELIIPRIEIEEPSETKEIAPVYEVKAQHSRTEQEDMESSIREKAATSIQSVFRGFTARKEYNELQQEEKQKVQLEQQEIQRKKQEEDAATKIQSNYRGYQVRKKNKKLSVKVIPPQPSLEVHRVDDVEATGNNPLSLRKQNFFLEDSPSSPKKTISQGEIASAIKIQSTYRGYKSRKGFAVLLEKKQTQLDNVPIIEKESEQVTGFTKDEAAIKIQSNYRGYRVRKHLKSEKAALTESNSEQSITSTENYPIQQEPSSPDSGSVIQEEVEIAERSIERNKAAIKIQSSFRGYKGRKLYQQVKSSKEAPFIQIHPPEIPFEVQNKAATKIQSNYRGYRTRRELKMDQSNVPKSSLISVAPARISDTSSSEYINEVISSESEDNEEMKRQEYAATKIQKNFRNYREKIKLQKRRESYKVEENLSEDEIEQDSIFEVSSQIGINSSHDIKESVIINVMPESNLGTRRIQNLTSDSDEEPF